MKEKNRLNSPRQGKYRFKSQTQLKKIQVGHKPLAKTRNERLESSENLLYNFDDLLIL